VKFVCDGCGKKYATAEDPSAGKVYKLKCKACGHLIVVKAQAGTSTAIPALSAVELATGARTGGTTAPELEIEIEPEQQATPTPPPVPAPRAVDEELTIEDPAPLPPEVASAIDGAAPVPSATAFEPAPAAEALPRPPPPEKDELADFAAAAAEVMAAPPAEAGHPPGYVDLFADGITGERAAKQDPFAEVARASLPSGYAGADPLAPRRVEPPARSKAAPPPPPARSAAGKGVSPLVFVALGVVLIGGITAVAISQGGKKPEPAPVVAAPAPTPAPPPVVAPPLVAEPPPPREEPPPPPPPAPVVVEKKPEPKAEAPRPRPPERKPEPRAEPRPPPKPEPKVAQKPEPKPEPRPPPEPVEARVETRDVQLPDAEATLTPDVVQKVITANRKAFASCIAAAGSDVRMDGRKVALKLTVNANGAVTYPTLDDVTLNPTEMGQCLKSAARLMIFPKFRGDPFHVEVPLTLSN
jgi:DNA-directed RNA polymerase subunit RPC12/RpoP